MKSSDTSIDSIYPVCRAVVGESVWDEIAGKLTASYSLDLAGLLEGRDDVPAYVSELAVLEDAYRLAGETDTGEHTPGKATVNPTLHMLDLSWRGLTRFFEEDSGTDVLPEETGEIVIVWRDTEGGDVRMRPATDADLLALKIVVEEIDPHEAAEVSGVPIGVVDSVIDRTADDGILIKPPSLIRRYPGEFPLTEDMDEEFLIAKSFTLQWHITQACDLHCRHCYDRTDRTRMGLSRGIAVLDDMRDFCRAVSVRGHVTFSGGNPLMHPDFLELYRAAADRGFGLGVLGNPTTKEKLAKIMDIAVPSYYQVSLEGFREHNDHIRGAGHFDRTLEFIDLMNDMGVYSMVMLTLTRDNMDQVIPLGEMLEGRTESFNFNRLSPVGEGASLALPDPESYAAFLEDYLDSREKHPHMKLKDNLFSTALEGRGLGPFDGCTGHGCGAAFNFISVLADGEAHACRKFPSPIGNVYENTISEIYDSEAARKYRKGTAACDGCALRASCGGCMSIAYGMGLNPFGERDPFCLKTAPCSP